MPAPERGLNGLNGLERLERHSDELDRDLSQAKPDTRAVASQRVSSNERSFSSYARVLQTSFLIAAS